MALSTMTMIILGTMAATSAVQAGFSISAQKSAAKRAKSIAADAGRARAEAKSKSEALIARAGELPEKAKAKAASIAAGRRRKRMTVKTGPQGLLSEPVTTKPTLLGA